MTRREGEADNEGQIYTLKLSTKPTGNVIVTPFSCDPGAVTVHIGKPESLTFTTDNWSEEQRVRVRPESDKDPDEENVTIKHKVSGGGYDEVTGPTVRVTVNDDDDDTSPTFNNRSVEDQSYVKGARVDLQLPAATGGNGRLSYGLSDSDCSLPAGLSFSFNDSGQRLSGTPEKVQKATAYTYTVTDADRNTSLNDGSSLTFTIEVIAKEIIASDTDMTLEEGEADNEGQIYTLKLSTKPTGNVIVTPLSSPQGAATVRIGKLENLTFTTDNWGEGQRVRVRPVNDMNFEGGTVTIKHEVSGGGYGEVLGPNITVTVKDNSAGFIILGIKSPVKLTKSAGIVGIVGIIIIVGIITWHKGRIVGYIVKRKDEFIMPVVLTIFLGILSFIKTCFTG